MNELVSIIIPTKNSANTIDKCLKSIMSQTYKNIETIIVDSFSEDGTKEVIEKYSINIITGHYNKPEARNIGFLNSKGELIVFADSDFIFSDNVVENIVKEINKGFDAIIIPEKILNDDIISKVRNLEKDTYIGDDQIEAARVYTRYIVNKIGLFDENIIGPDEYDFYSRVVERNNKIGRINSLIYIIEPSFWKLLKKKYNHGRYWRIYSNKHKNIAKHQTSFYVRTEKLCNAFKKDPFLGGLLFLTKGLESLSLLSGIFVSYFDREIIRLENDIGTKYDKEAGFYEQKMYHSNIGSEYVNKTEKDTVLSIMKHEVKNSTILDVGAGNGRWSREFLKLGLNVVALDISEKMCDKLKNDIESMSFNVNNGTIEKTEFRDKTFDAVFSFRSFKYVHDDEKTLYEINRILKDDGIFIVEIPNYLNPFYFPLYILAPFLRYIIKKDAIEYMCITKMYSSGSFKKTVEKNGFKIDDMYPIFFFPHGIFSRINNDNILRLISKMDRMLRNIFTARSLIFILRKMSYQHIPSNQCIIEDRQPLVSVVIPTYNRKEKLIRLIDSVLKSDYTTDKLEIIVIDDTSTDGTAEEIKRRYPSIKIIRNQRELLLAGSRNAGIKNSRGEYIFLVDDDNVIDKNCIKELVNILETDRTVGISGPIMFYFKRPDMIWWVATERNMITSKTSFPLRDKISNGQYNRIINSKDVPNAFMIKRNVIEKTGLFDDKNFAIHYDEADFGERVRKEGYKIVCNYNAKVWHDMPLSKEVGDKTRFFHIHNEVRAYYAARNRILFHKKYSNWYQYMIFISIFNWLFALYYLKIILESDNKDKMNIANAYIKGIADGIRGI